MSEMQTDVSARAWKSIHVVIVILGGLSTTLVGYQTAQMNDLNRQVTDLKVSIATINASRFSASDALAIWNAIAASKENAVKMQAAIENNTRRIDEMQARFDRKG